MRSVRNRKSRPITIGRALLENKTAECGGVISSITLLKQVYGISISRTTYYNWIEGWSAPNGNPCMSSCETVLEIPTRGCINHWLGITDDSWWWTLLDMSKLLKPPDKDPLIMSGLRPPE